MMTFEEKILRFRQNGFDPVWVREHDGCYHNPILHTDYSDPDIIRHGDDFFMTASSFNNVPGLPVLHSKDLVNWKLVNYALKEIPFQGYEKPQYGKAVWAPSIRYHEGIFYIYVGFPDEGIVAVRTDDPFGEWDKPVVIKEARGFIDTCPFWDDDGQAYLINAFAKSRIGFKSVLAISKMSPDGMSLTDEFRIVYDGNACNPTIEGPKLYKRNGYYYISAPAGGVKTGWQIVLRSKNIYGPYEEKIVLHQGNTEINGPHQGGWVETLNGEFWFLHFQDCDAYGRIVHLQPMRWENGWPLIGMDANDDGIGEPVKSYRIPVQYDNDYKGTVASDDFNGTLLKAWQWNANPPEKNIWLSLEDRYGYLRLFAVKSYHSIGGMPNILTQKFPAEKFSAVAKLEFHPLKIGERAGLVILGREYASLQIINTKSGFIINRLSGYIFGEDSVECVENAFNSDSNIVYFKAEIDSGAVCRLYFSFDSYNFTQAGSCFTAVPNRWVGAKLGLFCSGGCHSEENMGFTDIDWFVVE